MGGEVLLLLAVWAAVMVGEVIYTSPRYDELED